ncbi:PepSY domain-containing protein [Pedobacter sandarakinus]|uniref:PepSY domain-containing protein n=1 Tax=Pedobacter sandarakinus TaxID=353156 RepID=UPI00224717EE|nr:PepSY domain-containing protein [Pedobacter sandarakinus]MCX2575871.1 PepSY domain-containing protein [Pedobacter sandarakinus]
MTISIWRYSHLALAISSFLFLTLASVTGVVLSFKPVVEKSQSYRAKDFDQLTLAKLLPALKKGFKTVDAVNIDHNQFVIVNGTTHADQSGRFYIDPNTGVLLGKPAKESAIFTWSTNLHRSLFLHETGRFFIGLSSFLLFLIATSGTVLIIQRQRGIKRFFTKIVKDGFAQYYHVILGRLLLVPIIIISLTGTYLSLERFGIIKSEITSAKVDFDALKTTPRQAVTDFDLFKQIHLSEVQEIEFPFSEDVEDYFTIKLASKEITVNQITGALLTENRYSTAILLANLSTDLHTGRTNAIWAIVLGIASANIMFFIYSGFVIMWKRRSGRVKNKFPAGQAEYIILVGSENGSTFKFANAIKAELIKNGKKPFVTELNNYQAFSKAKQILVLTATYGLGDAPTNAVKFSKLLAQFPQPHTVEFGVLAFGSHAYPDFCKFGYQVNNLLSQQTWAKPVLEIHTVNDRSLSDFNRWATLWAHQADITLDDFSDLFQHHHPKKQEFEVLGKVQVGYEEPSFLLRLSPLKKKKFTSGDLLTIYPANDHRERQYSIGKIGSEIQLSVKLHTNGLGSGFLYALTPGQKLSATIISNPHFHFPKEAKTVIFVSNGTGIAPFLGMVSAYHQNRNLHLYCGFKDSATFALYEGVLGKVDEKLKKLNVAYSRQGEKTYVKDLLAKDSQFIVDMLKKEGVMMLCGSLSMQKDVLTWLDLALKEAGACSASDYQAKGQILMDCY